MIDRRARLAELRPYVERARVFSGWDHSALAIRPLDGGPPWDYEALANGYVKVASRVLDLGTGGGERFASIARGHERKCVATEEWSVNAPVAYERLRPLGVPLVCASSLRLPFPADAFDLILSRHEEIDPAEIDRVLAPGGRFLTQQVTPDDWPELRAFFPRMTVPEDHYQGYPAAFRGFGYEVSVRRHDSPTAFGSLGDLVFMLATAPWSLPDFDLDADFDALLAVEQAHGTHEGIVITEGRYLLEARKPR